MNWLNWCWHIFVLTKKILLVLFFVCRWRGWRRWGRRRWRGGRGRWITSIKNSSKLYLKDGSFQWHFPKNTPSLFKPNKKFPSLLPPPTTVIYNTKTAYYLEEKVKKKTSCQKFWPEIKKKIVSPLYIQHNFFYIFVLFL